MVCPHCNHPVVPGSTFCNTCGQPLPQTAYVNPAQQMYNQEVSTMSAIVKHFSPKKRKYESYDKICNELRRDRGSSKALLIWGAILLSFALFLLFMSSGDQLLLLLIFGVPGLLMLIFGIVKVVGHNGDMDELYTEYVLLSKELITHYKKFPSCPVPIEYTNPAALDMFYSLLRSGRVLTIRDSIAAVVDPYRKSKAREYLNQLQGSVYEVDVENKIYNHFVHFNIFR